MIDEIKLCQKRIKKVAALEVQAERLYNEIFSPELWRAKESITMARLKLEAELRKRKELSVKP